MQQKAILTILIILAELSFLEPFINGRLANRNAALFAESAQLVDRNADRFAESTKIEDRIAKRFADQFTKIVNCRTIHSTRFADRFAECFVRI